MRRSVSTHADAKRMDALLALPLAPFRRALAELTPDELSALAARLAMQRIRSRWARGGRGVARHRSPNELGLLARREVAMRREMRSRRGAMAQPRPIEFDPTVRELAAPGLEDRAA